MRLSPQSRLGIWQLCKSQVCCPCIPGGTGMASVLLPGMAWRFLNQVSKDRSSHDVELVLLLSFMHIPTPQNYTFCWESE